MKILIAFLITFSIHSTPTHTEIDAMTFDSTLYQLFDRIGFSTMGCSVSEDETGLVSDYDRIFGCSQSKPSTVELANELIAYKAELHAERNVELAEIARVKDIMDRLKALKHKKQSIRSVTSKANPMAWLRDNIHKMDKTLMASKIAEIEAKDVVLESEYRAEKSKEDSRKAGLEAMRTFFKNYDCSTLGEFNKRVCQYIKHKR